ncbi:zinc finger in n-recognin protein [Cyclospora cayetanensis]|uniref:Zinc finger in n-recognin protein n=1 Tax=Cyclospora cayetanensis TaxID=88456 RepID=A0A1D3D0C1_9EIME|nr:zinc finger in n-recognin protein [Cyclospora cayetanensis]
MRAARTRGGGNCTLEAKETSLRGEEAAVCVRGHCKWTSFARVRRWEGEVEAESLALEDDFRPLKETRDLDAAFAVWCDDIRLIGRRLPFPPKRQHLGAAFLAIRPPSPPSSADACGDCFPSNAGSDAATQKAAAGEYLKRVVAARKLQEAAMQQSHDRGRSASRRASQLITAPSLSGVSSTRLNAVAPPYPLMQGLAELPEAATASASATPLLNTAREADEAAENSSECVLTDEERRGVLLRVVALGLTPWLRKVHLLLKAMHPDHKLPFEEAEAVSAFGVSGAPLLPSGSLKSMSSPESKATASAASGAGETGGSTLEDVLTSLKPFAPDAECDCLLEGLPLPQSLEVFLFGSEEGAEDEDLQQQEAQALVEVFNELQMLHALAALPPSLSAPSCVLPVIVAEKDVHEQLLQLLENSLAVGGRVGSAFLSHSLYYQPLTRRFLPSDFLQMLEITGAKAVLLWQRISSTAVDRPSLAIFALQNLPFPAVLPKSYQQLYNHFLDVQYVQEA